MNALLYFLQRYFWFLLLLELQELNFIQPFELALVHTKSTLTTMMATTPDQQQRQLLCSDSINGLGWESGRHVRNMSPRQPNVGTFGPNAPVVATQNWPWHIFLCRCLPTFTKFFYQYESYILEFLCKIWLKYLLDISIQPWYLIAPLNA